MTQIQAIKAEIERRTEILTRIYAEMVERKDDEMRTYYHGKIVALEEFLSFIESLDKEQTDIDFEKEYKEYVEQDPVYSKLANGIVAKAIATHFYNLGKESRK